MSYLNQLVFVIFSLVSSTSQHAAAIDNASNTTLSSIVHTQLVDLVRKYPSQHTQETSALETVEFLSNFNRTMQSMQTMVNKCMNDKLNQLDAILDYENKSQDVSVEHLKLINTYLVASIDHCSVESDTFVRHRNHQHAHEDQHIQQDLSSEHENSKLKRWLIAFLCAFIISIIGVLCVIVVPLLNRCCFDYLFQFLVALAIGTLTGDAFLHLMPHALIEHSSSSSFEEEHNHESSIYKFLGALFGIYLFFIIEKLMKTCHTLSDNRKRKRKLKLNDTIPKHESDLEEPLNRENETKSIVIVGDDADEVSFYDNHLLESVEPELVKVVKSNSIVIKATNNEIRPIGNRENHLSDRHVNSKKKARSSRDELRESSHSHRHHGHGHSHLMRASTNESLTSKSSRMKSNAWMVIMGDVLHNFSDGLAIGASFANSIVAGIGTTVAIFFHELPHEIGDFAVLRKSGVSLKRAVFFNLLSSVFCFVGILLGLLIGSIQFISDWSFLFIAGVFIYISLADMLPELSNNNEVSILDFFIQNVGFLVGVGIMFMIALYEDKLINLIK